MLVGLALEAMGKGKMNEPWRISVLADYFC